LFLASAATTSQLARIKGLLMPISTHSQGSAKNRLLAALPGEVFDRLLPHLHPVSFEPRHVVYESNEQMEALYFPTTCVVSLLYTMTDDATAEIGLVGNDGVVGIALFMGGSTRPNRAVVQVAGDAFSVPAPVVQEEFKLGGPCQILLLRYTQALITKISQTAVCNCLHTPEQRFCRWLLRIHDRVESAELRITHEFIAKMLGGRREGVTRAAGHLQAAGLIRCDRGQITILDRQGLEAASCECYQVVKNEIDRLLNTGL
jgi:CRP-like cAMP-binding protein